MSFTELSSQGDDLATTHLMTRMNDLKNLHVAEDVTTLPRPSTDYFWVHDSQLDLSSATQHASSTECQLFLCVSVTWYVINSSSISFVKPIGNVSRVKCKCWYSNLQVGNGHANPWSRPRIHTIWCFPLTKAIDPPRSSKMWNRPHPLIWGGQVGLRLETQPILWAL